MRPLLREGARRKICPANQRQVYRLDRQDLAEQHAGGKVKVTGTLDPQTDTIMVRTMEPGRRRFRCEPAGQAERVNTRTPTRNKYLKQ